MKTVNHHSITLPTVLKEYSPEYEPQKIVTTLLTVPSPDRPNTVSDTKSTGGPPTPQPTRSQKSRSPSRLGITPERTVSPDVKERKKKRITDAERFERLSYKWDQAKEEVRQDDHELLKEKIVLQQGLIRRQDELARQKKQTVEDEEKQRREEQKQRKREMEAALLQKCKESLEEDRKNSPKRSPTKDSKAHPKSVSSPSPHHALPQRSPGTKTRPFQPNLPPMSRTPTNPDFLEREASWSMPNPQDLEMHQFHLYKMFGKGADDFLHPKIEPVAKKTVNSKLRKQGGNSGYRAAEAYLENSLAKKATQKLDDMYQELLFDPIGRAGAQRLWNTLRKESYVRLLKEDAHVPTELKETYSAFIRESIDKDRKPIRRFFCAKEDVPELGRLQDQTALVRVRNLKHKIDLMYRASRNNQDRTEILLHNNQLPEVALSQEEPDVSRYLPSWMDDWSDSSDPDYLKWVREVQQQGGRDVTKETINEHEEEIQDGFRENKKYEGFDDELILLMTRKKHNQAKPKYVFLTESDTRSKGRFTDKFRDEYDNKDIPKPFDGTKIPMEKAKSVLGLSTDQTFESDLPTRRSAPIPERHRRQLLEYTSRWEPLSMNALIEYKKKKEVEGEGEFNQGRPKMWTTEIKVS